MNKKNKELIIGGLAIILGFYVLLFEKKFWGSVIIMSGIFSLILSWKTVKEIYQNIKENYEKIPVFEQNLVNFLNILFSRKELSEEELIKELRLTNSEFQDLKHFAKNKGYIIEKLISKPKSKNSFEIEDKGLDFLLEYQKIRAQKKGSKLMRIATYAIASSAIITLIINYSPAIYPTMAYTCPSTIYPSDYTATFNIPVVNVGWRTATTLELISKDFKKISFSENIIIAKESPAQLEARVRIINPELDKAYIAFEIRYKFLGLLNKFSTTKTCYYEKDDYGNFILKD